MTVEKKDGLQVSTWSALRHLCRQEKHPSTSIQFHYAFDLGLGGTGLAVLKELRTVIS